MDSLLALKQLKHHLEFDMGHSLTQQQQMPISI
jgi:hypothetical protein